MVDRRGSRIGDVKFAGLHKDLDFSDILSGLTITDCNPGD
jgi:hypothetical protein